MESHGSVKQEIKHMMIPPTAFEISVKLSNILGKISIHFSRVPQLFFVGHLNTLTGFEVLVTVSLLALRVHLLLLLLLLSI